MGLVKPRSGSIKFDGIEIGGLPPYQVSRLGIAYVPQGRRIFPNLSTKENLLLAARKESAGSSSWNLQKIYQLFPILKDRESSRGRSLSGGEQQMLTIARGLMQNPRLLIMDEVCEGLAPIIVAELADIIQELKKSGVTILLAEQNIKFAMRVTNRCYILEKGQVVFKGDAASVPQDVVGKFLATQ
jgi:branched-chain amino acid transport system ATP-binding protein